MSIRIIELKDEVYGWKEKPAGQTSIVHQRNLSKWKMIRWFQKKLFIKKVINGK